MSDYSDYYDESLQCIVGDGKCQYCNKTIKVRKRGFYSDYSDGCEIEPKHTCDPEAIRHHCGY